MKTCLNEQAPLSFRMAFVEQPVPNQWSAHVQHPKRSVHEHILLMCIP